SGVYHKDSKDTKLATHCLLLFVLFVAWCFPFLDVSGWSARGPRSTMTSQLAAGRAITGAQPMCGGDFLRRIALVLIALLIGAACGEFASGQAAERPNILFLFSDDQSPRTVGCYPQSWPWVKTPNMDRLAKSGIRFTHCYLGSWCMPSRAN